MLRTGKKTKNNKKEREDMEGGEEEAKGMKNLFLTVPI